MFFFSYAPYWLIILTSIAVSFLLYKLDKPFLSRKILHIASISACALATQVTTSETYWSFVVQLFGATTVLWFAVLKGVFKTNGRKSWGIAYFPSVLMVLVLLFPNRLMEVGLSFTILAWSDGLSAILGKVSNRFLPTWNQINWGSDTKTIFGSVAFGITTFICLWCSDVLKLNNNDFGFKITFVLFLSISSALVEMISSKGRDNIWVPLWVFFCIPIAEHWNLIHDLGVWVVVAVVVFGLVTTAMKWLHISGVFFALILGALILLKGLPILPVLVFFTVGSLASKLTKNNKSDEKQSKPRDAFQVIANGGWVGGLAFLSGIYPDSFVVFEALVYVSMSVALSDTLSSELGMFFKGTTWSITTFKSLPKGVSGGVSFAGSLFGFFGALIIATLALSQISGGASLFMKVVFWGFGGMLLDSVIGDLFQKRYKLGYKVSDVGEKKLNQKQRVLNNDQVNLISNGIVVLACFLFSL